jgi:hypothetical protein
MSSDDSLSNQIQTCLIFPCQFFCQRPHFTPNITKYFQLYGVTRLYVFPLVVHRIVVPFLSQFFLAIFFCIFQEIKNENKQLFPTTRIVRCPPLRKCKLFFTSIDIQKRVSSQKIQNEIMSAFPIQSPPDDIIGTTDC